MAQAIKTVYTYNLDGSKKEFNVPFEYLARKFVRVTLIGKDRKILVLNQDYRFSSKTSITTTQAWGQAQGYSYVEIRRYTSATERLIDYTDGSILRAYDLNISQLQTIHVAEEARDLTADTIGVNNDGDLDARGRRIVNLVDAVNDRDAVTFGQVKQMSNGAWNARNQAEAFKNQAQGFRNEAEVSRNAAEAAKARAGASELKAKQWASNPQNQVVEGGLYSALHYANNAKASNDAAQSAKNAAEQSKQHSANSQAAAALSQQGAAGEANRAKDWASKPKGQVVADGKYSALHYSEVAKEESAKLGNMNQFAGTIDHVSGEDVTFKGHVTANRGFVANDADGLRIRYGAFGLILRQDGGNTYFLMTNKNDQGGGWNNLRPLYFSNETGKVTMGNGLSVSGGMQVAGDIVMTSGGYRIVSNYNWGGALAGQLNSNAAYYQQLPGNQDGNVYYPMIKQYGRRSNGFPTALSMGLTSRGSNGFHTGHIVLSGDNNNIRYWGFDIDGNFSSTHLNATGNLNVSGAYTNYSQTGMIMRNAGRRHIQYHNGSIIDGYFYKDSGAAPFRLNFGAAASCEYQWESNGLFSCSKGWKIAADGNVYGSTWGNNWLHTWLNENTVNRIQMGGVQNSRLWRGPGISDGGGKVVTGVVNGNSDDLPDNVQWRVMQYVRNNGRAYNIY